MRIGIFTNVLTYKPSGIGWHVIHLLENLAAIDAENQYFLFYRASWAGTDQPLFCPDAPNFQNVPVRTPDLFYQRYFRVFDRILLPRAIRKHRIDVFHGPNHYLPTRQRIPQVVTYHDLAEAKFQLTTQSDQAQQQQAIRRCLPRADRIIAISECTKRDLIDYDYPEDRINVIYQGGNFSTPETPAPTLVDQAKQKFSLTRPYVLFIGSLVPRKNLGFLVRSYAAAYGNAHDRPQLVLGGANDTDEYPKLRALAESLGVADSVVYTGYLTNDDIKGLYGGAGVFVLPSLYEGFGMVILEAMAYGVPVIATRAGSLEEVVGDAGLLVDLDDEPALADAITRVLADPRLAEDLIRRGHRRVGDFSWRTTAEQTLAIYTELAASRKYQSRAQRAPHVSKGSIQPTSPKQTRTTTPSPPPGP